MKYVKEERQGFITLPEVGRLLGVSADQIKYAHEAGFLPEPPRVQGRRTYDLVEVIKVAKYFGVKNLIQGEHR